MTFLLSVIAGSLISVAGITYAVSTAVLTFASSQFGTACIDRLTEARCACAQFDLPSPYRHNGAGRLRVVATDPQTFEELASVCYDNIRRYGVSSFDVTVRLLDGLTTVAPWVRQPSDLDDLRRHAQMLERGSRAAIPEARDRGRIGERFTHALGAIESAATRMMHADAKHMSISSTRFPRSALPGVEQPEKPCLTFVHVLRMGGSPVQATPRQASGTEGSLASDRSRLPRCEAIANHTTNGQYQGRE